jgi:hypothetical protein
MSGPVVILGATGGIGAAPFLIGRDAGRLDALAGTLGAGSAVADVTGPAALRVAVLADFLLSNAAGGITGQAIGVDGGRASLRGNG